MPGRERARAKAAVVTLALALGGCEEGCLSRWLRDHGVGGEAPGAAGPVAPGAALTGTDCSDGLLRCREGRVEASRAAHVPYACGDAPPGKEARAECVCPWDLALRCPSGCAAADVEILGPPSAAGQLCRPTEPVLRVPAPFESAPSEICSGESLECVDGVVRACAGAGVVVRPLAACLHGCEPAVGWPPGPSPIGDGVASILCRRDHAERR